MDSVNGRLGLQPKSGRIPARLPTWLKAARAGGGDEEACQQIRAGLQGWRNRANLFIRWLYQGRSRGPSNSCATASLMTPNLRGTLIS